MFSFTTVLNLKFRPLNFGLVYRLASSLLLKRKFSNRQYYLISEQDCSYQEMTGENGLEVIGAGFSKTGTKTMHQVYKILGYGVNDSHENVFM